MNILAATTAPAAPTLVPGTILLIEDDLVYARLIEKNFRRAGVTNEIVHISDGTKALAHLFGRGGAPQAAPMLVLLDLNLPDMSGIDILARIKQDSMLKHTPVVMLTTSDDQLEIQQCYELGCNVYITKPSEYAGFATAIQQLGLFLNIMQVPRAAS
ncbi:MAG: response regulator [Rhodospirillales bacterium]